MLTATIAFINKIRRKEYSIFLKKRRNKLKNHMPSIISSNCNGGVISHDLGLQFRSPTVNLWFRPEDFLKLLKEPKKYIGKTPVEVECIDVSYPVGQIDDVLIFFQHYKNFEEAKSKWIQRSGRVDYNNLFVMMTDRDGCTKEMIEAFDELPYKHKVIFTHVPYPQYDSAFYVKGFENDNQVGILTNFTHGLKIRKYIDSFDIVSFINN